MKTRCERQNLGFEPLILESTGGMTDETDRLLRTLSALVDRKEQRPGGSTWHELSVRLSIDLQRGLHGACSKQRLGHNQGSNLSDTGAAFMATCV